MGEQHDNLIRLKDEILPAFATVLFRDVIAPIRHPAGNLNPLAPSTKWMDYSLPLNLEELWEDGGNVYRYRPRFPDSGVASECNLDFRNVRLLEIEEVLDRTFDAVDTGKPSDQTNMIDSVTNGGSEPVPTKTNWKRLIEREKARSAETGLGSKIAQTLQTTVSGTIGIAEGEVQTGLAVENYIDRKFGSQNRRLDALEVAQERTYTAAPFTHLDVLQKSSVKRATLRLVARGRLECRVTGRGVLPGNGTQQYRLDFDSLDEIERVIRGERATRYEWFSEWFTRRENRWSSDRVEAALKRPVLTLDLPEIDGEEVLASSIVTAERKLPGHPEYEGGAA